MIYLLKFFKNKVIFFERKISNQLNFLIKNLKILIYLTHKKPFKIGYDEYKWNKIEKKINNQNKKINELNCPGIDERIIEYKWIINELENKKGNILDAGSVLNYAPIIKKLNNFDLLIQTLYPEKNNFSKKSVSYIYSDLKKKIFEENYFDFIACISTLEHIGFDNTQYNYYKNDKYEGIEKNSKDYLKVIENFKHILKKGGYLYITIPFGKKQIFEHLQQFDSEDIKILIEKFNPDFVEKSFYIYKNFSWIECDELDCKDIEFRTQKEKNPSDKAASARSVIFLKLRK